MASKLAIVAITGISISVVCLGAAAAIGARQWSEHGFDFFDGSSCGFDRDARNDTRTLDWNDGDTIGISVPATVHYQPGQGDKIVAKGNASILSHLRVRDGEIEVDCHGWHGWRDDRLDITLPGRIFREFALAGSENLTLQKLDQPDLAIDIAGHGDVKADGKADNMKITIAGHGDADMTQLAAKRADITIMGHGDVDISPSDDADVTIMGSGDVRLHSEPAHVKTNIMGSGSIEHLADSK